jgi:hypothetical protein
VGLDTHKRFTEVDKNEDVKDAIQIEIQVLNAIVPEHSYEELAGGEYQSTLHKPGENIGISSEFFSIGYGSQVVVRHRSISFSRRNPLLTKESISSVFSFTFFHSLARLGRGVEGGDNTWPASSTSLRLLFFDALVFELFVGDVFILQVTGVFTRIRSGLQLW